jgi:hypothetical protein
MLPGNLNYRTTKTFLSLQRLELFRKSLCFRNHSLLNLEIYSSISGRSSMPTFSKQSKRSSEAPTPKIVVPKFVFKECIN